RFQGICTDTVTSLRIGMRASIGSSITSPSSGAISARLGPWASDDKSSQPLQDQANPERASQEEHRQRARATRTAPICLFGEPEHVAARPFHPLWKAAFLRPQPSSDASPFSPTEYQFYPIMSTYPVDTLSAILHIL